MAKASGASVELPDPITRREKFLAKAAGVDVGEITPITREEMFLNKIVPGGGSDEPEVPHDGKARIYITLREGRISPMVGLCPDGTVSVDWGDRTEPDVLTGTSLSTSKWTPNHSYPAAGDYIITLSLINGTCRIDGERNRPGIYLLRQVRENESSPNMAYNTSINRVLLPSGFVLGGSAFQSCSSLVAVNIPEGTTAIGEKMFYGCHRIKSIAIPKSVNTILGSAFTDCASLDKIVIPDGVTRIDDYVFQRCYNLTSAQLPKSITSISAGIFNYCILLDNVTIPDGVTSIGNSAFETCAKLTSVIIPSSVDNYGSRAFAYCYGVKIYDFSQHIVVPTLSSADVFSGIPSDCEIRVPAALYDEWIAATNWVTYASQIVAV